MESDTSVPKRKLLFLLRLSLEETSKAPNVLTFNCSAPLKRFLFFQLRFTCAPVNELDLEKPPSSAVMVFFLYGVK